MYHVQGTVAAKVRGELTAIYRFAAPVSFGVLFFLSLAQAFDCFGQLCPPRILSQVELPETYNAAASHHLTADGGFIFGGTAYGGQSSPSYGAGDFFIVRFDPNLQEIWEQSFGGPV